MTPGQSYPSPTAAQVAGSAGPFFGQNGDASQIPHDLQQLSDPDATRGTPSMMAASVAATANMGNHGHQYADAKYAAPSEHDDHQRLAQNVMSLNDTPTFSVNVGDNSPVPRKRTKVSRACDECRRKKIRCDATVDSPNVVCSSCKRTGAPCQFSRQPMKRGPSKGYIKELADRLNALEGQVGASSQQLHADHSQYMSGDDSMVSRMADFNDFSPPPGSGLARKRTHSMSEGFASFPRDSGYHAARASEGPWSTDPQRHLPHPQTPRTAASDANVQKLAQFSPNGMRFDVSTDSRRGDNSTVQYDDSLAAALDWDEAVVDEYYRIIHPTFPLLSQSKDRLRSHLAECPPAVRDAFLAVLDCTVRSYPSSKLTGQANQRQSLRRASELIASSQFDAAAGATLISNIVYIQTLVLMALEADTHGISTRKFGPTQAEWLGRAIGVACNLKLDVAPPRSGFNSADGDIESDEKLGRRIWGILFVLGHWHSSGIATSSLIPAATDRFNPDENLSFGDSTFHLARLSRIAGHLSKLLREPSAAGTPLTPLKESISDVLIGELTFFRESVEGLPLENANLVYICYWHFRLLVLRYTPTTPPSDLLVPAQHVVTLMGSPATMLSPLSHHFAALAALALSELCGHEKTRADAEKALDEMMAALNRRSELTAFEDGTSWDSAVRELVSKTRAQLAKGEKGGARGTSASGLQHLADAAIGGAKGKRARGAQASNEGAMGVSSEAGDGGAASSSSGPFDRTLFLEKGYLGELAAIVAA